MARFGSGSFKMTIHNILCDLGGVLYEIDYKRTFLALGLRSREPWRISYSHTVQAELFDQYEMGLLSTSAFREALRERFTIRGTDHEIDHAWNALLIRLMPNSLTLVQQLKEQYRLALLSNINDLHFEAIALECAPLFELFETCYFSYRCRLRKPQPEIFRLVCEEKGFLAAETLFIDDSPVNIAAGKAFGLQTYHVTKGRSLADLVKQLKA
jgi:glucose-1-phosphatase